MITKKFRPVEINPRTKIRAYRLGSGYFNWRKYDIGWWPSHYQINHKTLSRQFSRLHYLAVHAPEPVRRRWLQAYRLFKRRHFANPRTASNHYIDFHTVERWI